MNGFTSPNHTQVPNDLFDCFLSEMGFAELKITLCAIRQTLGFHRGSDAISLSQFMRMTGLSRQGALDGIAAAKKRGVLEETARGKRGVPVYRLVIGAADASTDERATSQASRPVKPVDQSSEQTSASQASRPVEAATSQASRHTKERKTKETFKEKEHGAPARDSTPVPFHIANGLGSNGKHTEAALVLAIKEHPAFQAFVSGWDGITPEVNPRTAQTTWDGLNYLQQEIDAGRLTYRDIEDVTRWKVSNPRTQSYQVIYVKSDLPAFKAAVRAESNRGSSKSAHPRARAAPETAPPANPSLHRAGVYVESKT